MSTKRTRGSNKSSNKKRRAHDALRAKQFLDELSWVLSSYDDLDWRLIAQAVPENMGEAVQAELFFPGEVTPSPNIHFLVGVLPRIFVDEKLFPTNEDIAKFSYDILGVELLRWSKKSKHEIIGRIVCSVYSLDDSALTSLVRALGRLVSGEIDATTLVDKTVKDKKINWNQLIRKLS